jgi:hypothetical protein
MSARRPPRWKFSGPFYRTIAADAVFQVTMLVRTTLLAAALAVLSAAPASAQNPNPPYLDGLRPCYVAANDVDREFVPISGHNFTPFKLVNLYVDDIDAEYAGDKPQADAAGLLTGAVRAPFVEEGERVFTIRASEQDNPAIFATAQAKVTRLSVEQTPAAAKTSERVRFKGRGFTALDRPVYMHYVFAGKSKKTISLGVPTDDCGLFSVRRKQFPFKKSPQVGVWTIQFDQKARYDPKASPRVPLTIKVRRKIKPTRAGAR